MGDRLYKALNRSGDRKLRYRRVVHLVLGLAIVVVAVVPWLTPPVASPLSVPTAIGLPQSNARPAPLPPFKPAKFKFNPSSPSELMALTDETLAQTDIARVNLLCALDLPGAEGLDIDPILARFDRWAEQVHYETERHLYRVDDPRHAEHYRHSEAYLRTEFLLQVLQEDCGVRYNLARTKDLDNSQSQDWFLHGFAPGGSGAVNGGTCISMPILYAAIGRRLGYPIKLVLTSRHMFCRWDGAEHPNPKWRARFNIEGTNGFGSYSDDYYLTWPDHITKQQAVADGYLVSLTPREELAQFLAVRGHCLLDNRRVDEAVVTYRFATRLDRARPSLREWAAHAHRIADRIAREQRIKGAEENRRLVIEQNRRNHERQMAMLRQSGVHLPEITLPAPPAYEPLPGDGFADSNPFPHSMAPYRRTP